METINWSQKTADEIYDFFDNINDDKEAVKFLIHLLKNHSEVEIDWIDMLADVMYPLFENGEINIIENFIEIYRQKFPDDYKNDYAFVENEFISYYLFNNDIENVKKRLEIIKQNPVSGADVITIKALFQLIYHGYYELAYEYSKSVWKPLYETEELIGVPHYNFSITIYLHELEKKYQLIKNGQQPDILLFEKEMNEYDLEEDENLYRQVFHSLSNPLNKEEIASKINNKEKDVLLILNIQFLKYMEKKYNMPFMLSDRFWNIISAWNLFGTENSQEGFFYIPYTTLEEHFKEKTDEMFMSNEIEMFGKVWGLNYVYTFLHEYGLISDNYFSLMNENIHVLKNDYIQMVYTSLWEMNFVHKWSQIYIPDPYEVKLFDETFKQNDKQIKEKLENYYTLMMVPERIQNEIDKANTTGRKKINNSLFDSDDDFDKVETFVREEPKIGRNDPCPCGSGKKYKKCCLNND